MKPDMVPLKDVASYIKRGVTPNYVNADGIFVLNQKCIRDGRVSFKLARLTNKNTCINAEKILRNGDILINSTGTGTLGRTAPFYYIYGENKVIVDTHITILRPNPDIVNPRYLAYVLRQNESAIVHMAKGATNQVELSSQDLGLLPIRVRSMREQKRIASTLSIYDDLIENNRRRINLLEEAARQLYKEWFVRFRFPGHEKTKIIDDIPEGWEKGIISDFYRTSSGGTPSRKKLEYYTGEINWVKTKELKNSFILETEEKITEEAISNSSAKLFPKNTVLLAMYGATIGQIGILSRTASCNQACCALLPKAKHSNHIHIFLFLQEYKDNFIALGKGSAQNNISQEIIKNYPMIFPPEVLMNKFFKNLSSIFIQIKNLNQKNRQLEKARNLLIPKLMNGEIAV